ncbi:MAG: type II toxin-antitoxin system RelE family toxin [Verrucomicrobiota bacterium]
MNYRLEISEAALAQLRELAKEDRRRIGQRLDALQGDVWKLAGQAGRYRLRVENHRVLFAQEKDLIMMHQVTDRKDACRD